MTRKVFNNFYLFGNLRYRNEFIDTATVIFADFENVGFWLSTVILFHKPQERRGDIVLYSLFKGHNGFFGRWLTVVKSDFHFLSNPPFRIAAAPPVCFTEATR